MCLMKGYIYVSRYLATALKDTLDMSEKAIEKDAEITGNGQ